jgi:protein-L-isoaspartate(D-aspartate) O-methyltransferase
VLGELAKEVYSIEIVEPLGKAAGVRLKNLGYENVFTKVGDGYLGWPEHAPFDKIIVTCSPEKVPGPLVQQLKEGGKMIIPLGERYQQVFHLFEKKDGQLVQRKLIPTLFVPMTGVSEDNRQVKPDPLNPKIINGGFETDANQDDRADNWHYQRQTELAGGDAPEGGRYMRPFAPGQPQGEVRRGAEPRAVAASLPDAALLRFRPKAGGR